MDEIDQLLANLGSPKPSSRPAAPPSDPAPPQPSLGESAAVSSIEDLLGSLNEATKWQVRDQLRHPGINPQPPHSADRSTPLTPTAQQSSAPSPLPPDVLHQIKTQYQEHDRQLLQQQQAEQAAQQQKELDRQHRQQQLREQRRAEIAKTAQKWLKQLKPNSEEGRWFDEFACNYESRLEAAIDYLEALQEVNSWLKTHPTK
ncbi:salt stress protein, Slr1339 family [Alkalinema pantanalense CENA528]|uniref:salt stress protein, Slr1339 family n=1 Tax=Alkalinema pantanalense TaxID=1620705 RepID=UPI003D6DE836